MRVAIIGGGFCGVALALQLARRARPEAIEELCIVEPSEHLGPGVAYATPHGAHLLNVRAREMGADADDKEHFARYLAAEGITLRGDFAARALYGRYLRAYMAAQFGQPAWRGRLRHCRARATDVAPGAAGAPAQVQLDDGSTLRADRVALCLGNTRAHLPAAAGLRELAPPRALLRPWQWESLAALPTHGSVLLLGTGLTMVDVVLVLAERRFRGPIVALSRRGLAPQPHLEAAVPRPPPPPAFAGAPGVREMVRALRAAAVATPPWQSTVDSLRPLTPRLWAGLDAAQRAAFLRHVRPYWDSHRHRIAPAVAQLLDQLTARGQLQLRAARLREVVATPEGVSATIHGRGSAIAELIDATCVVNCTGADVDWRRPEMPLLQALQRRGLVQPDALGLGAAAAADGALHGSDGRPSAWLYALGSVLTGRDFESVAVPELRLQAQATAAAWVQ